MRALFEVLPDDVNVEGAPSDQTSVRSDEFKGAINAWLQSRGKTAAVTPKLLARLYDSLRRVNDPIMNAEGQIVGSRVYSRIGPKSRSGVQWTGAFRRRAQALDLDIPRGPGAEMALRAALEAEVADLKRQLEQAVSQRAGVQARVDELETAAGAAGPSAAAERDVAQSERIALAEQTEGELRAEIRRLKAENERLASAAVGAAGESERVRALERRLADSEQRFDDARQEVAQLTQQLASQEESDAAAWRARAEKAEAELALTQEAAAEWQERLDAMIARDLGVRRSERQGKGKKRDRGD